MYVCICHGLTEKKVQAAALESGGCSRSTYKALGYRPKCGKCVEMIQSVVRSTTSEPSDGGLTPAG